MTDTAKTGLRIQPAAADLKNVLASASVEAIAAALSDEHKTGLSAALTPPAAADPKLKGKNPAAAPKDESDPEDAEDNADGGDDEDAEGEEPGDKKTKKMKAAAFAAGRKAAAARITAVASSEHFEGREKVAMKLLGSDKLLGASADDIVGILAETPKGSDASAEMLAALRAKNPDLGGGDDDQGAARADADHGWGKAQAKAAKLYGHPVHGKAGH